VKPEHPPEPSKADPRLAELAGLLRVEHRRTAYIAAYLLAVLLAFSLVGFLPGPVHRYAEELCQQVVGHADSRLLIYGAAIFVLLLQAPLWCGLALYFRLRPAAAGMQLQDRLEYLRKTLLDEGLTARQVGLWSNADRRRLFNAVGVVCVLFTILACAALYGLDHQPPVTEPSIRDVSLGSGDLAPGDRVRISGVARLDLAIRSAEESYGYGILTGTRIDTFRLDRRGFTATTRGSSFRNTLFVPLAGRSMRADQPIRVIYRCDTSCAFTVSPGSPVLPMDVTVSGRLHRSAMPLFVKRGLEGLGIRLTSPYYVLTDAEEDPADRRVLTGLAGSVIAAFFFALAALYGRMKTSPLALRPGLADERTPLVSQNSTVATPAPTAVPSNTTYSATANRRPTVFSALLAMSETGIEVDNGARRITAPWSCVTRISASMGRQMYDMTPVLMIDHDLGGSIFLPEVSSNWRPFIEAMAMGLPEALPASVWARRLSQDPEAYVVVHQRDMFSLAQIEDSISQIMASLGVTPDPRDLPTYGKQTMDGWYVEVDQSYQLYQQDRGAMYDRFSTRDLNALRYEIVSEVLRAHGRRHRADYAEVGTDPRRAWDRKQSELMSQIDPNWATRWETELEKTLARDPYSDGAQR
jgi:hypothetical protein